MRTNGLTSHGKMVVMMRKRRAIFPKKQHDAPYVQRKMTAGGRV